MHWASSRSRDQFAPGYLLRMHIIACIEDPAVIKAILAHLADKADPVHAPRLPPGRAIIFRAIYFFDLLLGTRPVRRAASIVYFHHKGVFDPQERAP
jgi:hypothetical protein